MGDSDTQRLRSVRGPRLEIGPPSADELNWIFEALQRPQVYGPFGYQRPPTAEEVAIGRVQLVRGERNDEHQVRFHALRNHRRACMIGFVVDFGWDFPHDTTREVDLTIPYEQHRTAITYVDAWGVIAQYMFGNRLAKRLRWRQLSRRGHMPVRPMPWAQRSLGTSEQYNAATGDTCVGYLYEFSRVEFDQLLERLGVDPAGDYFDLVLRPWQLRRQAR